MSHSSEHHTSEHNEPASRFAEIPRPRCEELLRTRQNGRVAWNAPQGPLILPVTYAYRNDVLYFRTSPHGALSSLTRRTNVAFEIDEIDEQLGTGWSVLVLGFAQGVTSTYPLTTLWREGPVPWASGVRNVFIAITPRSITGRSVRSAEAR